MNLNPFEIISRIRKFKGMTDYEAFQMFQSGALETIGAVGGIQEPKIAHLFRGEVTKLLTTQENTVSLPEDSGRLIRVEVDKDPWSELLPEHESAKDSNPLFKRVFIRRGNELSFYGFKSPTLASKASAPTARIVFEQPIRSDIFLDGYYGRLDKKSYGSGGKTLQRLIVEFPSGTKFQDKYLSGSTLRLWSSKAAAQEWSIFTNEYQNDHQEIILNDDENRIGGLSFPGWAPLNAPESGIFPMSITRVGLPPALREAAIAWCRYEITGLPQHQNDFLRNIMAFKQ